MVVIRCTSKLLSRLDANAMEAPPASTNLLGDWYATLLRTRRGHYVLAIASNTLLPIVVTGRALYAFPLRLASTLVDVLAHYGVPASAIDRERVAMNEGRYARTDDRSTVGVLTEFQRLLQWKLEDSPGADLTEISIKLAHTPIVARNTFPENATCKLFGVPLRRYRERDVGN